MTWRETKKMLRVSRSSNFWGFTCKLPRVWVSTKVKLLCSKGLSYRESTVSTNRHPMTIEGKSAFLTHLSDSVTKLSCTDNHFHLKDKSFGHTSVHKTLKNFLLVQSDWRKDACVNPHCLSLDFSYLLTRM